MIAFLKCLPQIIGLIVELKKFVDSQIEAQKRKDLVVHLTAAIKEAHETGDTSALESLVK